MLNKQCEHDIDSGGATTIFADELIAWSAVFHKPTVQSLVFVDRM
jgi:hypothetical protein